MTDRLLVEQHETSEAENDSDAHARLYSLNVAGAVTLLDVVVDRKEDVRLSGRYVSGSPSHVSAICRGRFPHVWRVIEHELSRAKTDRAVVRIASSVRREVTSCDRRTDRGGLFGSLYDLTDANAIDPGGLIADIDVIAEVRRLWGFHPVDVGARGVLVRENCGVCGCSVTRRADPNALPSGLLCHMCGGACEEDETASGLTVLAADGLRVLVETGLFDVLFGGSRNCAVGTYDMPWRKTLVDVNTRDEASTAPIPSTVPLPADYPQRLPYVARDDVLYLISTASVSLPRTPEVLALTEVSFGYLWCMFDNTIGCVECINGLSIQSMYATFAEYHHFSRKLKPTLEELARGTAEYVRHCLVDHPNSMLCRVMDSFTMATQAVYLDVLHTKATEMRFDRDELMALRYRMINSGSRTIVLFSLLEGSHNGLMTDTEVEAVTLMVFSVHDGLDRRCDIYAHEASNLFNIVAAHNEVESAYILGSFCTDVLAWAVDNESLWPLLIAGRFFLWQIHTLRYRPTEILGNLRIDKFTSGDFYCDRVLNSFNPLLTAGVEVVTEDNPHDIFSVRNRSTNRGWYDRKIDECLAHFSVCMTCDKYDQVSWDERTIRVMNAYLRKHAGDCSCIDTMAIYSSLALLDQVWWSASAECTYTGPTGEWDPFFT